MDFSSSIAVLFDGLLYGCPAFEERVGRILKVGRVNTMRSDPTMRGRILGISCNKFEKFIADTGTFVAIIPRSVVEKNKLQLGPVDPDEPDYEGVTGMKLTVVGQTEMQGVAIFPISCQR